MSKTAKQRLQQRKAENEKPVSDVLPKSAEKVTFPGFVSHGTVMKIFRKCGEKSKTRLAAFTIAELVRFDGEKFTVTDVEELLESEDVNFLTGHLLGGDDDASDEGEEEPGKLH